MTAISLGTPYITRAELGLLQPLLPVTLLSTDQQDSIILGASRAIDAYVHTHFAATIHTAERHEWNKESLRAYPTHWPVIRIARMRIHVANTMFATILPGQIFINNQEHYVQIVSPALIASFASPIFTLTMAIPVVEMIYAAGRGEFEVGSTLAAAVNAVVTTLPVADETPFSVGDVICIGTPDVDEEWMVVASKAPGTVPPPDTVTVVARGAYGTTAIAHVLGAPVYRLASAIPDDVKVATASIVAALVNDQVLQAEGLGNLKAATIGSYSITLASDGGVGGFRIPPVAEMILEHYRLIVAG